eukprot:scaffold20875_cov85-Skeletonema_dohrnii-CCMP3373.AAC.2
MNGDSKLFQCSSFSKIQQQQERGTRARPQRASATYGYRPRQQTAMSSRMMLQNHVLEQNETSS